MPAIRSAPLLVAIVDDDESVCKSLGRLLSSVGMTPVAYSSAEAFVMDAQRAFDCLVLDVRLGGISGVELQQRLFASGSRTPVIFITADDTAETRQQALTAGCAGFFHKTAPGAEVIAAIRCTVA